MKIDPEIHVEELKKDPEFLANIARLERECKEQESIAKGYQLLDAQLIIEAPEEEINEIFTFIVNTAFDRLAEKLTTSVLFDMNDDEDRATARAIYEHGIQRYSENDKKGAKEIFLVLYYTMEHKGLKDAMMVHAVAVMAGHDFEDFIENLVDVEEVDAHDPLAFFIQTFTEPTEVLLQKYAKQVEEAHKELRSLDESK
ncbi:MAG TPA: hypothetical protein PLH07_04100 [Sulfurovum sp.]|jgi:hypothetical protein|nr:MAG: hypothetical protein B7Y63_03640 [Sulfurovum sp. 35-42-20]OYY57350.1 MAG: hypothetical protein B7Y52_01415 [Sulfurovum sp. 28-43-6]OYZ25799.1 MAG: hypothetical protein B7Y23_03880 [Sulfurovum sp. 16-42-52]OYZ49042.1 MAG: hypothetical protein B7Y13_05870 [Sulfurovum sp. 24-42-9]OZA45179.1 MAG: hypothetical protein B7X80_05645 [Sulfurovum sp. 17-42-90]OZA59858.1 MAG: hypothetical protein B7X69_06340 [Sulfurovum sp. 39-42-12]HQR73978.1 hypothetical protein [Sulfurovum sp.]